MRGNKGIFLEPEVINLLLIFAVFFSIIGFFEDIKVSTIYGGIDLRNRVVGARLAKLGKNPYFFKWDKSYSYKILDPRDYPELPMNRLTVPPTVLQLHSIFCDLPYKTQRYLWTFLQWIMLLLAIHLFAKTVSNIEMRKLIWIINLFFIASGFIFRLHVERGQIYILYTFLFALGYNIYNSRIKFSEFLSGLIIGYAGALRFPLLLVGLPFLLKRKLKFIFGQISGFIIGILSSILFSGIETWKSYFRAMPLHTKYHQGLFELGTDKYPYLDVEGFKNLWIGARLPISDSSIQGILKSYFDIYIPEYLLYASFLIVLSGSVLVFVKKIKNFSSTTLFLYASIMILVSELFIPAARYSYNNVFWITLFSLFLIEFNKKVIYKNE
jgi:hypothetical protein